MIKRVVKLLFISTMILTVNIYGELENVTSPMIITNDGAIVSGKHFEVSGKIALVIMAENVTVENCLFTNCEWAILINTGSHGATIKGNRFEMIGTAIRSLSSDNVTVQYNEVRGLGVLDNMDALFYASWADGDHFISHGFWASNFFQTTNSSNVDISYNIIDNKDMDCQYLEDAINFYSEDGYNILNTVIRGNKMRGTDNACMTSGSGGSIIMDCDGSGCLIEDNIAIRMCGYGMGSSGCDNVTIQNNYAYYPKSHLYSYTIHPHASSPGGSFSYCNTGYGHTVGTGNKLLNNYGYSINGGATETRCVPVVTDYVWNVYTDLPFEVESGNVFPVTDPEWDSLLSEDMFANLGPEYFSGNTSTPISESKTLYTFEGESGAITFSNHTLNLTKPLHSLHTVSIITLSGRKIWDGSLDNGKRTLTLPQFVQGEYLLQIFGSELNISVKIRN